MEVITAIVVFMFGFVFGWILCSTKKSPETDESILEDKNAEIRWLHAKIEMMEKGDNEYVRIMSQKSEVLKERIYELEKKYEPDVLAARVASIVIPRTKK